MVQLGLPRVRIFFPDCPDFIFPVWNKMEHLFRMSKNPENLHPVQFLIYLTIILCKM
jgi:hypothetical protein